MANEKAFCAVNYLMIFLQDIEVVQTWDITDLNATNIADTFIMCGVLYGLKSATERDTVIDFAYDLYRFEDYLVIQISIHKQKLVRYNGTVPHSIMQKCHTYSN